MFRIGVEITSLVYLELKPFNFFQLMFSEELLFLNHMGGPDTDYLWILSREPKLPEAVLERLLALASARGFETDKLIYVEH